MNTQLNIIHEPSDNCGQLLKDLHQLCSHHHLEDTDAYDQYVKKPVSIEETLRVIDIKLNYHKKHQGFKLYYHKHNNLTKGIYYDGKEEFLLSYEDALLVNDVYLNDVYASKYFV